MLKKKISCLIAMIMVAAMLLPLNVFAAYTQKYEYRVCDLTPSATASSKGESSKYDSKTDTGTDIYYMYRIKLSKPGFIIISCNKADNSLSLYKTFVNDQDIDKSTSIVEYSGAKKYFQVLSKGTYYLHVNKPCKFSYKFYEVQAPKNVYRTKASTLTSGKKANVTFAIGREASRYYKFTVANDRIVGVKMDRKDGTDSINFVLLNSKGKLIGQPGVGGDSLVQALTKGTYYIRVDRDDEIEDDDHYVGRFATLYFVQ